MALRDRAPSLTGPGRTLTVEESPLDFTLKLTYSLAGFMVRDEVCMNALREDRYAAHRAAHRLYHRATCAFAALAG